MEIHQHLHFITILTIFIVALLFCISGTSTVSAIEAADGAGKNPSVISGSPSPLPYSNQHEVHQEPFNPMIKLLDQPIMNNLDGNNQWLKFLLGGVILGSVGFLIVLVLYLFLCNRPLNDNGNTAANENTLLLSVEDGGESSLSVGVSHSNLPGEAFTYEKILMLTRNFSESNRIPHGHTGEIFLGVLENGSQVVIKRTKTCISRRLDYHNVELNFFKCKQSSNDRLVSLFGHCLYKEGEKVMVYRRMPNEDLYRRFHRRRLSETDEPFQPLDWITRMKIAVGVAEGLCYLHHGCRPPLVHRDIHASSILLDDDFEVRLGSLSKICTLEEDTVITRLLRLCHETSEPVPSVIDSPPATRAYDVYCFGRILLGLVTGNMAIAVSVYHQNTLPYVEQVLRSVSSSENEQVKKIMDPNLIVEDDLLEEVWAMAIVAKSCLHKLPSRRPHMTYVLTDLKDSLRVTRIDNKSTSARLMSALSRGFQNATLA